jgi:hypothetical protein
VTRRPGDERFTVRADIAHREIGGRLLLLLPGDSRLYAFNEPGRLVWRGLLRKRGTASIAATIAKQFRIPLARAERDVRDLLKDLVRRGVIRRV